MPAARFAVPAPAAPGGGRGGDIAIIGVAGRYPEAADLDAFWNNLRDGRDCVREIPPQRWDYSAYAAKPVQGKAYCRWGGFLDGVDEFDPLFFGISPREAMITDPQERLFLQCAFAALEDAGYTRAALAQSVQGEVGVYVGVMYEEYPYYGVEAQQAGVPIALSGSPASIANRVSYFCDFHGPSVAVDSMCSSSLATVHFACEALQRGDCALALAGGVNVSIHPNKYLTLQQGQFSASNGRCESFGRGGDGYVPGEGVGAVLLKPLRQAEADGDYIHAVIKASAINHGGRTNGYTVPNPAAQAQVIARALQRAGVEPAWISYVEAHGTGTTLGDPIEITGLGKAFGAEGLPRQSIHVGSVKSNIGHCESAAGIAGISKVLLQLRHGQIVPSLHSAQLNPNIDFADSPFVVPQALTEWTRPRVGGQERPRIAGVSSFGAGGANAHVVLAEYVHADAAPEDSGAQLFVLSARTAEQLRQRARQLADALAAGLAAAARAADIAYTLQTGRDALAERLAVVATDKAGLAQKLARFLDGGANPAEGIYQGQARSGPARPGDGTDPQTHWMAQGALDKLAEAWTGGGTVDWHRLHPSPRRRVPLPTYPYARQRYWYTDLAGGVAGGGAAAAPAATAAASVAAASAVPAAAVKRAVIAPAPVPDAAAAVPPVPAAAPTAGAKPRGVALSSLSAAPAVRSAPTVAAGIAPAGGIPVAAPGSGGAASPVTPADAARAAPSRSRVNTPVRSLEQIEDILVASLADALYMTADEVDPDRSFQELGLDSVVGVEWIRVLNGRFGIELAATRVYDYPTVRSLAAHIAAALGDEPPPGAAAPAVAAAAPVADALPPVAAPGAALAGTAAADAPAAAAPRQRVALAPLATAAVAPFATQAAAATVRPPASANVAAAAAAAVAAPAAAGAATKAAPASLAAIEAALIETLAEALYMAPEDIDPERPFTDLGLDSVVGVEWIRSINQRLGVDLAAARLYDFPSVTALAAHVLALGSAAAAPTAGAAVAVAPAPVSPAPPASSAPARAAAPVVLPPLPAAAPPAAPAPAAASDAVAAAAPASAPAASRPVAASPASQAPRPAGTRADAIAVVGMAARYPGAADLDAYWNNLAAGVCSIVEVPRERWDMDAYYDPQLQKGGKIYCRWLGALDEVDRFDSLFFNISPAEADLMDPQQRLFLEQAYAAFEDAGFAPQQLSNRKCGTYLGIMGNEYSLLLQKVGLGDATGNSAAIAAARIAYHLNLKGPAISIDTACSSSLVATHLACQALRGGEIDMALVGGVTLYLAPESYIGMCAAGMLSPEGRCKTCDNGANGFVPGEGAAALVLRRLDDALANDERIHGLIIASGINQDGKTNGITAPSVVSQTELEREVYTRFGIDPDGISCVEMHGTGTKLGDPVELEALATVFSERTARRNFCALGSVKSNVGHTSAAAGLAGVHKVLLQLRHGQLAPSLHFSTPNEHFDFARSPFYVNTALRPWPATAQPRRAAVSSFGYSGTNAHLVIEEFRPAPAARTPWSAGTPVLIAFSAKTEQQREDQARRLRAFLAAHPATDLAALAWTLQSGRDVFNHRLALAADSADAAIAGLDAFLRGEDYSGLYVGSVRRGRVAAEDDEDTALLLQSWLQRRRLDKLAEAWTKGTALDWRALYPAPPPQRISLPGYPFARERHWMPQAAPAAAVAVAAQTSQVSQTAGALHPLLQANTSGISQVRFSARFDGSEAFLADHRIGQASLLPGVCYLEMARAGYVAATDAAQSGAVVLRDVVFLQPAWAGTGGLSLQLGLRARGGDELDFDVRSTDAAQTLHAQGRAGRQAVAATRLDLAALRAAASEPLSGEQCYAQFAAAGFAYGPSHRGLHRVALGRGGDGDFALAEISLATPPAAAYVLEPGRLDAVLQASLPLLQRAGLAGGLPFALDRAEILAALPARCFAHLRWSPGHSAAAALPKLDIDVSDADGSVVLRLRGFSLRSAAAPSAGAAAPPSAATPAQAAQAVRAGQGELTGPVMLLPRWEAQLPPLTEAWPAAAATLLVVGGSEAQRRQLALRHSRVHELPPQALASVDSLRAALAALPALDHVCWFVPPAPLHNVLEESLVTRQSEGVLAGFRLLKALLQAGYGSRALGLSVFTAQTFGVERRDDAHPAHASVHGLIGSAAKEYPHWNVRLVDLPLHAELPPAAAWQLPPDPQGDAWAFRAGEWLRQQLVPADLAAPAQSAYRHGGVYVIVGGAGGIGEVYTEYLIRHYQAHVYWIGRREADAALDARRRRLAALGPEPVYLRADATDRGALERCLDHIHERHAGVHGLIHSAIVLLDKSLANMDEERFRAALAAKVDVGVRLAQVFGREELDFALFFSSLQSYTKAAGQSNYAAGCTFGDAYAQALAQRWSCPVKVINWGYWGGVGIVATAAYQQRMADSGIGSIEPAEAMDALEKLLAAPLDQAALIHTTDPAVLTHWCAPARYRAVAGAPASLTPLRLQAGAGSSASQQALHALEQAEGERKALADAVGAELARLLWVQLRSMGLFATAQVQLAEETARVAPAYARWLAQAARLLQRNGYLAAAGEGAYRATALADQAGPHTWPQWEAQAAQWRSLPGLGSQVVLIEATLRNLPAILQGRLPATDVLFRDSAVDGVAGSYQGHAGADYFNTVLGDMLLALLQQRRDAARASGTPLQPLRILEVGAGTGSTSALLFHLLQPYQHEVGEYCYTDISRAFLMHAEDSFGPQCPYLRCTLFNAELPLAGQDIVPASYDVVVATNVLHATRDIRNTLRNIKACLAHGGVLLLNEINQDGGLLALLTFALLKGWWLFEDEALRLPGCPALDEANWQRALEGEGFTDVFFPAERGQRFGQQIVVAASDGLVRQARTAAPAPRATAQAAAAAATVPARAEAAPAAPAVAAASVAAAIPVTTADPAARTQQIADLVRDTITGKLGEALRVRRDRIHGDDSFADFGVDSITGVALVQAINDALGIELATTALFEFNSVNALAAHILAGHADAIGRRLAPAAPAAVPQPAPSAQTAPAAPVVAAAPAPAGAAPAAAVVDSQRLHDHVKDTIAEKLCEGLRVRRDRIHFDDAFADYGVDSITGVALVQTLNAALGIELATTALFEFNSVNALAAHILASYGDALRQTLAAVPAAAAPPAAVPATGIAPAAAPVAAAAAAPPAAIPAAAAVATAAAAPPYASAAPIESSTPGTAVPDDRRIAVVGMSGRFARSPDLDALWTHLAHGTDLVEEVTRWDLDQFLPPGGEFCRAAALVDDIEKFDALFFKISGMEATYMDPQQRLFLEECWTALEDAGYAGDGARGKRCGVYVGCGAGDYDNLLGDSSPPQSFWGTAASIVPARIAYFLDLKGPAVAIDTACSASLVAAHSACQALWCNDVDLALVGGVHLQATPSYFLATTKSGMLSPHGRCHAFDARADGFVPGEGVGVVILKRLRDALADGDTVRGVIVASGINQDGTSNGITAPNAAAQESLIRELYERFDIDPAQIQLVEAHGTGTRLGDPIEFGALSRAFRHRTALRRYCAIGSIKTNLGHTATTAGIAGLLKLLLCLKHRKIVPSLHYRNGNPHIDFETSPFFVNTELRRWDSALDANGRPLPRRAAVSSFGFSGTNAHMVVEEAPAHARVPQARPAWLVVLSARTREQLRQQVEALLGAVGRDAQMHVADISQTLLLGRKHLAQRLACVARDRAGLLASLREWLAEGRCDQVFVSAVSEEDWREQVALRDYGNQCIRQSRELRDDAEYLRNLAAVADLYVQNYDLQFELLFAGSNASRIPLPTYPFQRKSYWPAGSPLAPPSAAGTAVAGASAAPAAAVVSPAPAAGAPAAAAPSPASGTAAGTAQALVPVWEPLAVPAASSRAPLPGRTLLIAAAGTAPAELERLATRFAEVQRLDPAVLASPPRLSAALSQLQQIDRVVWIANDLPRADVLDEAQTQPQPTGVLALFRFVKALLELKYAGRALDWLVVTFRTQAVHRTLDRVCAIQAGVHGLVGSMAKEHPAWSVRLADLPAAGAWPLDDLLALPADRAGDAACFRRDEWYRQRLVALDRQAVPGSGYRRGGNYVVLGGAGGIGEVWTEWMIRNYQARVFWIGRRAPDAAIQAQLDRLGQLGPRPVYLSADATDAAALCHAYAVIKRDHLAGAAIHGLVHSAIVLQDASLALMDETRFAASLQVKVDASVHLVQAFRSEELDFVLFFSSMQSFSKAPGQGNYAAGCTFKDAYARQLAQELPWPVRVMNWGWWGGVGIVSSEDYQRRMARLGMGSIQPEEGMQAVQALVAGSVEQMAFVRTTSPEVLRELRGRESVSCMASGAPSLLRNLRKRMEGA
ncbi:SDR family NAD(P)-dependent oxidoreductase [Tahibacter harae]|uniref:SDR family NAD(P)-dependent oxidoreductase n=1 Tax=Tahibacter harae TaxID=2963937 RepID=A0ABT1QZ95_9GAMM|nr:SDR family NAD(P)-dependent oxidoreductase [Tahibacter harae]